MMRLVTFAELRPMGVLYTRQHLYNLETKGLFPKRVKLGGGRVAWVTKDVMAWVDQKVKDSKKPAN